jgi:hypothetical protein
MDPQAAAQAGQLLQAQGAHPAQLSSYLGGVPNPSRSSYLGGGQYGVYGAQVAGQYGNMPQSPQDLYRQQRQANLDTRNYNRGLWSEVRDYTTNVPRAYANDPLTQGARGLAAGLLANPEAINDRTQQLAVNRASNLMNAAQNAQRRGVMQGLAARGMLGGSAQQAAMNNIERNRQAQLVGLGSDLEVQRAMRRNQDITNATNLASALAGQQAAISGDAARTLMSGVPYEAPDDLSGLGALLGANLYGALSGGYIPGANIGRIRNSPAPQNFGITYLPEGPSWSPYGLPYGTLPVTYSYGGNTPKDQRYGNWATGGPLDRGNNRSPTF